MAMAEKVPGKSVVFGGTKVAELANAMVARDYQFDGKKVAMHMYAGKKAAMSADAHGKKIGLMERHPAQVFVRRSARLREKDKIDYRGMSTGTGTRSGEAEPNHSTPRPESSRRTVTISMDPPKAPGGPKRPLPTKAPVSSAPSPRLTRISSKSPERPKTRPLLMEPAPASTG